MRPSAREHVPGDARRALSAWAGGWSTHSGEDHNMFDQTVNAQAQRAYEAAISSPRPDWRAVAELFRAALQAGRTRKSPPKATVQGIADYKRRPHQAQMPFASDRRAIHGRGSGVYALSVRAGKAAQCRQGVA